MIRDDKKYGRRQYFYNETTLDALDLLFSSFFLSPSTAPLKSWSVSKNSDVYQQRNLLLA